MANYCQQDLKIICCERRAQWWIVRAHSVHHLLLWANVVQNQVQSCVHRRTKTSAEGGVARDSKKRLLDTWGKYTFGSSCGWRSDIQKYSHWSDKKNSTDFNKLSCGWGPLWPSLCRMKNWLFVKKSACSFNKTLGVRHEIRKFLLECYALMYMHIQRNDLMRVDIRVTYNVVLANHSALLLLQLAFGEARINE